MSPETRRRYQREYARRRRKAVWLVQAEAEERCPAMLGNGKPCRWPLENRLMRGATVPFCAQCDRKTRGVCIDCRREPVTGTVGKALRCAACKRQETWAAQCRYKDRHPGKIKRQWRRRKARLLKDPVARQASLERKRLWRLASPKCAETEGLQCHHLSYPRGALGTESVDTLQVLCKRHHEAVENLKWWRKR